MPTISKRLTKKGEVRYLVQLRLKGCPPATATFSAKADARNWAQRTEVALRAARYGPAAAVADQRHTLAVVLGTVDNPRSDQVGSHLLSNVSSTVIAQWRDHLARRGGPHGGTTPATCNRYLAALSHVFTIAEKDWGWIDANPCRRVRRLTEPRGRVRFLSDAERERLLGVCRQSRDARLYPLVVLAIATGARQAELIGLRWSDIDLQRRSAILHKTKNGERRSLPLTGLALELLRDLAAARPVGGDHVFPGRRRKPAFPRRAWEVATAAAGLEDFRFHDLRHSCASYLAMSGASAPEIAAVLGHKTLAMVKRYAHLAEPHTAGVVARMTEKFLRPAAPAG